MYLKLTDHYKGRIPVDIGGLVLGGRGQKEVDDRLGKLLAASNFPLVAECDRDGKFLVEVPAIVAEVEEVILNPVETEVVPVDETVNEEIPVESGDQPVIETVEDAPKSKKSKKSQE